MSPTNFLRRAATAAIAAGILALSATDAHATHFRYGTIKWRVINPTATNFGLEVTAECAWRRSFYTPQPVVGTFQATGQNLQVTGTGYSTAQGLSIHVTAINTTEDWFVGNNTFTFNGIPNGALPLRVFWNGNARISTLLDGNHDLNFNVEARVGTNQTNLFSPVASLLPIVNVAWGLPAAHFFIPATDPEGDTLTWSISSTARSALCKAMPDGAPPPGDCFQGPPTLSINPNTGEVTWNTAAELAPGAGHELYAVQFLVTDSKGGEIPVDALLRLVPNTSQPPVALINDSPDPATFDIYPNSPVSFVFKGTDPDVGDVVTLAVGGGMPVGATFTPTLPFSGTQPQSSTFNWTPGFPDVGAHVISLSVTDPFGLQDTTSATITVLPNFQPNVICPGNATMEATGPTTPYTAQTTVDDPEHQAMTVKWFVDNVLQQTDNVPASPNPTTLNFPFAYTVAAHALRVEVSDGVTNPVICNATVTVVDTTPPVIDMPPSQILEATSPAGAVATWSPDPPHAVDLVDGPVPVHCNHVSGETFPILPPPPQNTTTVVTCTATDAHNNTATNTFDITVQDTTPPIVSVPANITVEATGPNGAVVTYPAATAVDIVDGNITPTCNPPSGSTFPLGVNTVNCTATDVHGNTGSASFTVTVQDTTPPVVTVPADITQEATGPNGAVVTFTATAFDIVDGNITPTCNPPSGSTFALLPPPPPTTTTVVHCTATDAHGNTGTASFNVTIQDTTPPVISNMPGNITVPASGPGGAIVTWPSPTAFDIVDQGVPVTCVPPSGSLFPIGTTTVTCSAHDVRNNTSSRTFTVTVLRLPPPAPCVTLSPGELWPPNHKMRDITVTVTVSGAPICHITNVTSTEPVTGHTYGDFAPDWIFNNQNLDLQLRSERYDRPGRTYTITVACIGPGGVGTVNAHMLVPHDQRPDVDPPNITCAAPQIAPRAEDGIDRN
jgi:hypothetical protein